MGLSHGKVVSQARLDGKTVIITGANTGIGKVTAERFVKLGGHVIIACRDVKKGEDAAADIRAAVASATNKGDIRVVKLDLGSLESVRESAQTILATESKIHLLVNNAGVCGYPYSKTKEGFEMIFGVNHLGHFLFTCLLLPRIIESAPARIVNVAAKLYELGTIDFENLSVEEKSFSPLKAYCNSKLANILFTNELAKKLEGSGVTTYSLHPGVIMGTELARSADEMYFPGITRLMNFIAYPIAKTLEQGAETTVYCSIDEKAGTESGLYYSDCRPVATWAKARNEETAKRLWEVSAEMVQLDFDPFESLKNRKRP